MSKHARTVSEVDRQPLLYRERPHLIYRRRAAGRRALELGLAAAVFLLLPSCEQSTAPAPQVRATTPSSQKSATPAHTGAQIVVGTGNPDLDVPAVQAAVDQGGDVILKGQFSFDRPPTIAVPFRIKPRAMVLVSRAVAISGAEGDDDAMTTIKAGSIPFFVNAPGQRVTIRGLRFVRPFSDAIFVSAVRDLEISSCRIEGLDTFENFGEGMAIMTSNGPANPTSNPGKPENVSGSLLITNNDIDVPPLTARDHTLGVVVFRVGVVGAEVEVHVSGNTIRNTNEPAVNLNVIEGHVYLERNVITSGPVAGGGSGISNLIRLVGTGSYVIAHNRIECKRAQCIGIALFSGIAAWPMKGAVVEKNDVLMSPPEGTVFGDFSAGIGVYGFARANVVRRNRIRGSAKAAVAIPTPFPLAGTRGVPTDNAFIDNSFAGFSGTLADIFVVDGALRTLIMGRGTVVDRGVGTVIIRSSRDNEDDDAR